jgi:glycosyltransferase involved in cell wall biosynthesis
MQSVRVVHEDPMTLGGAEAVLMHTLEALQSDYDVTVVAAEPCDLTTLNEQFNTDVHDVSFTTPSVPLVDWRVAYDWARRLSSGRMGVLHARRIAFFQWAATRKASPDVTVFTKSESPYGSPSLQYVHHPMLRRFATAALDTPDRPAIAHLERLTSPLADSADFPAASTFLTNSEWTAKDIESVYGVDAAVCPPPVRTADIPAPPPDADRENAVIVVGRVVPNKRQHLAFEILERVREKGTDLELSLVGPLSDGEYGRTIERMAAGRDWATVYGRVPREQLVRLLASHRYGLHCHEREHFGIVVAEMVAAGVVPLVPNDGGQVDIVSGVPALLWETPAEAAVKLHDLCDNPAARAELRGRLPDVERAYGAPRFRAAIRHRVESLLEQSTGKTDRK